MTQLSEEFVRAQFPAFQETALRGQAFFENAGGSYACRYVIWRLHRFYRERKVQPYAPYEAARLAGEEMDEAQNRLAKILGVPTDEVAFGPSTTQNTYVLANAVRAWLSPGDAIVVTNQDHEANSGPWRRLAQAGVDVREWTLNPDSGSLEMETLDTLLEDGKVRLVCFPHCSNVVAEINDVAGISARVHRAGAYTCVDGVSYAPHGLPDVGALGADIYLFSSYKTYGPHQGIMVVRRDLAEQLPNQGHFFNGDVLDKRFTPAGPDHAQVAACAGIADYVDALYHHHERTGRDAAGRGRVVHELMREREIALMHPLLAYFDSRPSLRLLGPREARRRAPTFALALDRPGEEAARDLAAFGIMAGGGDFYAVRPLDALGVSPTDGVLRLSFTHYTSEDEITRLIDAMDRVL